MQRGAWSRAVAVVGALALWACAHAAYADTPDAWVTAKVKMALITNPDVGGLRIDVDTNDGVVTLHGIVPAAKERDEAERITKEMSGVRSVRNLLQVVPNNQKKAVGVQDDQIEKRVEIALKNHPGTAEVEVKSVNNGVVLLVGKTDRFTDHLEALEIVSDVPGVVRVASEINSPDTFADREIWYSDEPAAPSNGGGITDAWITAKTKFKFMTDPDIPARDINVDTRHGTVILFGIVPNKTAKEKAKRVAASVTGVKGVKDELKVVPPEAKKVATANDGELKDAIEKRLKDANLEGADIHVEVKGGVARLTGSVPNPTERYVAVRIASSTDGVTTVRDDLKVEPSMSQQ